MQNDLAISIRNAYEGGTIEPLRDQVEQSDEALAYAVQQINTDFWIENGRRLIGKKIGLTSPSVQKQLGVDQPDFGALFADMAYGSSEEIDIKTLLQPKAEAEIALVLEKDLTQSKHNYVDIINATAYALPCIEIADSRIKDWDIRFFDTVADNASAGCFVLGSTPVSLSQLDLEMCGMKMERNGEVWLADKMVACNNALQAGDIILSGALGPMVNVTAGDSFKATISGLGSVQIYFSS